MEKKLKSTLSSTIQSKAVKPIIKPEITIRNKHLPSLNEFTIKEYTQLKDEFTIPYNLLLEVIVNKNDTDITRNDIRKLDSEDIVDWNVMVVFSDYLNALQTVDKRKRKEEQNRCFFSTVEVVNYSKGKKQLKFRPLGTLNGKSLEEPSEVLQDNDKIILTINLDGRWIVAVFEPGSRSLYIADFLNEGLSSLNSQELYNITNYIIQKLFSLKCEGNKFYSGDKLSFISDCGLYALNFLYKSLNNSSTESISVSFTSKDFFKKQLLWLLFKLRDQQKNETQFLAQPQEHALTARNINKGLTPRLPSDTDIRNEYYNIGEPRKSNYAKMSSNDKFTSLSARLKTNKDVSTFSQSYNNIENTPKKIVFEPQNTSLSKDNNSMTWLKKEHKVIEERQKKENRNEDSMRSTLSLLAKITPSKTKKGEKDNKKTYLNDLDLSPIYSVRSSFRKSVTQFEINSKQRSPPHENRKVRLEPPPENRKQVASSEDTYKNKQVQNHHSQIASLVLPKKSPIHLKNGLDTDDSIFEVERRSQKSKQILNIPPVTSLKSPFLPKTLKLPPVSSITSLDNQSASARNVRDDQSSHYFSKQAENLIKQYNYPQNLGGLLPLLHSLHPNKTENSEESDTDSDFEEIEALGEMLVKEKKKEIVKKMKKKLLRIMKSKLGI